MINADPNMSRKQIFKELPLPSSVKEGELLKVIYKAVFIAVKLLLDSRLNIVKMSEGKKITTRHKDNGGQKPRPIPPKTETGNTVIKDTDKIETPKEVSEG